MRELHTQLSRHFTLGEFEIVRPNLAFVALPREHLRSAVLHLRDICKFSHLVLLTAVDWLEEDRFQLTYLLHNRGKRWDLGLRVLIPRLSAHMESIHDIWPTAATYQRELKEMFGINFPGSPGVDESFILEGWKDIPPYRRDFDTLKYAEETFSHREGRRTEDPADYMKAQLYSDET